MDRRGFIRTLGLLSGAIALPHVGLSQAKAAGVTPRYAGLTGRVGLLLPQGRTRSQVGRSLRAGLALALGADGAAIDLVIEPVGRAGGSVEQKAARLIEEERVDLLVGVTGPAVAPALAELLAQRAIPLIALDTGASALRPGEESPAIFHNTLGYWRTSWAMGEWSARHLGKRAFVAASFTESGFDALRAFGHGFEAGGGQVVTTRITQSPSAPIGWAELMAEIRQAQPDLVYAMYSGERAVQFVQAYAHAGLAGSIPLVASPYLVDEAPALGAAGLGIKSCHTWAPDLENPANQAFVVAYQQATGTTPDSFALLGYEAGQLALEALRAGSSLTGLSVASPRGRWEMVAPMQVARTPLYLREVRPTADGPQNVTIGTLAPVEELTARAEPLCGTTRTGWLAPHLAVL